MPKNPLIFLIILVLASNVAAQQSNSLINEPKAEWDSVAATGLQNKLDSLEKKINVTRADSTKHHWQTKIDSIKDTGNLNRYRDSLKVIGWADSLRTSVTASITKKQNQLYQKMDSLLVCNQPTASLQQKTDSLQRKQQALLTEISAKQNQLQQKLNNRYRKWVGKMDSLGMKEHSVQLPNSRFSNTQLANSKMPNLDAKVKTGASISNAPLPNAQFPSPQLPALNTTDFAGLNLSKDLKDVGGKFSLPNTDQLKQWDNQLKDVKGKMGELNSALKDPGKAAEDAAKQIKDVSSVGKELGDAAKLLKDNEAMKAAEKMKDPNELKEEAAKKAIDHFAGKEEQLKQAMDQMAKYKKKIPSLESLDKLPKHLWVPRNGLKGKPFRERVRFGMNIGFQNRRDTLRADLFPNLSYNLTGRVELGGGFIYRLKWGTKNNSFDQVNPAWGFNMFGTFKTYKSVRIRLESDAVSTPKFAGVGEPLQRQWRWTWLLGLQTDFNISKNCTGNVQMLYNFDRAITAGFPEQLVLRVGVQWKVPKKKVKVN